MRKVRSEATLGTQVVPFVAIPYSGLVEFVSPQDGVMGAALFLSAIQFLRWVHLIMVQFQSNDVQAAGRQ